MRCREDLGQVLTLYLPNTLSPDWSLCVKALPHSRKNSNLEGGTGL